LIYLAERKTNNKKVCKMHCTCGLHCMICVLQQPMAYRTPDQPVYISCGEQRPEKRRKYKQNATSRAESKMLSHSHSPVTRRCSDNVQHSINQTVS